MTPVEESWTRIVDWLERSAPATAAQIGGPAPGTAILEVGRIADRPVPDDLVRWWLRSGGSARDAMDPLIPALHVPLTVADAMEVRRYWLDLHIRQGESIVDGVAGQPSRGFHSAFVPISTDCYGQFLFVDLRDGPLTGCVAQWDSKRGFDDAIHWISVADMLADIADALTLGVPAMTFHAAGRLRHFPARPDVPVATYRATPTEFGRLAWTAESC